MIDTFCWVGFTAPKGTPFHNTYCFRPEINGDKLVEGTDFDGYCLDDIIDELVELFGCSLRKVKGLDLSLEFRNYDEWECFRLDIKDGEVRCHELGWVDTSLESWEIDIDKRKDKNNA